MNVKFLQDLLHRNESQASNRSVLWLRAFIYCGIFLNLLLPFYHFKSNSFNWWDDWSVIDTSSELTYAEALNSVQYEYYLKHGFFSKSLDGLAIRAIPEPNKYSYRILSPMVPATSWNPSREAAMNSENVIMITQAKYPTLTSYISVVFAIKDKDSSRVWLTSGVCEIERYTPFPSTMPTLVGKEIQCPPDTNTINVKLPKTSFLQSSDHQQKN